MTEVQDDLQRIAQAARKAASARQELEVAIRDARATPMGLSLRAIAKAAGLSHEQVRRIAG